MDKSITQFPLQFSAQPRARESDPLSSHLAAREVKESGRLGKQQAEVLAAVKRWPGLTSAELASRMAQERGCAWFSLRHMVARRLPDLEPIFIVKGKMRRCSMTTHSAVEWWPVMPRARAA
jgi:hypothetical protein